MRQRLVLLGSATMAALMAIASPSSAQAPRPAMAGGPPPMAGMRVAAQRGAAELFLAHTGDLQLTDQQVVKLAAIARRAAARRQALRASMDSARTAAQAARRDTVRQRPSQRFSPEAMQAMQRERDAAHADLRDALSVLTADQQARLWEMRARGGAARGMTFRGRGDRPGPDPRQPQWRWSR